MMRVRIPSYGIGEIISMPDHHSVIVRLDGSGKLVRVELYDCVS